MFSKLCFFEDGVEPSTALLYPETRVADGHIRLRWHEWRTLLILAFILVSKKQPVGRVPAMNWRLTFIVFVRIIATRNDFNGVRSHEGW